MKKYYILPVIGILVSSLIGWQRFDSTSIELLHVSRKYSSGALAGYTGAPGENNCTTCHTGSVQNGDSENIFEITQSGATALEYTPGETYDITVSTYSNVTKKGFEITALNANNTPAGVFTASSNTQLLSPANGSLQGRKYVTHTSGTNSPSGWSFTWTAPNTIVGEITFYLATNKSNASNSSVGDLIYLSTYSLNTTAGLIEQTKIENDFLAGYSPSTDQIVLNFENELVGEMYLNLVDINGKSVFTQKLGKSISGKNIQKIKLPDNIANGLHFVNFFIDNKVLAGKVMITK